MIIIIVRPFTYDSDAHIVSGRKAMIRIEKVALKWIMLVLILGTAALAGWYGAAAIRGLFL